MRSVVPIFPLILKVSWTEVALWKTRIFVTGHVGADVRERNIEPGIVPGFLRPALVVGDVFRALQADQEPVRLFLEAEPREVERRCRGRPARGHDPSRPGVERNIARENVIQDCAHRGGRNVVPPGHVEGG
jgi:hypothetical protein